MYELPCLSSRSCSPLRLCHQAPHPSATWPIRKGPMWTCPRQTARNSPTSSPREFSIGTSPSSPDSTPSRPRNAASALRTALWLPSSILSAMPSPSAETPQRSPSAPPLATQPGLGLHEHGVRCERAADELGVRAHRSHRVLPGSRGRQAARTHAPSARAKGRRWGCRSRRHRSGSPQDPPPPPRRPRRAWPAGTDARAAGSPSIGHPRA